MSHEQLENEARRLWKAWQAETDKKRKEELCREFHRARLELLRTRKHETN